MGFRAVLLAAALGLAAPPALADPTPADLVAPAAFDYYVLSLSWSPGFCDTAGADKSLAQCAAGSGAGFVVHGLWPDSARGADPRKCGLMPDFIPGQVLVLGAQIYPSRGLAIHEWREHGVCTGLDAAHYFRAVQYARDLLEIPPAFVHPAAQLSTTPAEVIKQFADANPNLTATSMAVTCERGELTDVRICLTRDLRAFARCPRVTSRTCRDDSINVSPLR